MICQTRGAGVAEDGGEWDSDGLRPVPGFLRPIDTQKIAKDLRLAEKGAERGRQNLPPADTNTPDATEQTIVQTLESVWTWNGGALLNHLRSYASRLDTYSIDAEFTKLKIEGNNALAELRSADHRAEAELGPLREHFLATKTELDQFKTAHRLQRSARSPAGRWTSFGLLFVLVAVESVLNGVFFAKGSSFGLIGGVGTAVGISIVNVAFAFLLGLWPARWINHRNYLAKLMGAALSFAGLALLLALHGFAAHLREATAAVGEEQAFALALQTLISNPLGLNDLNSFYLFGLGMVFAVLAMLKGYFFDDPYPRYGSVFRRFAAARDEYSDAHADLFDELQEIKNGTLTSLRSGITRLPTFPQIVANLRAQRHTMIEQFRGFEANVQTAVRQLLAIYRDANMTERTTDRPAHFSAQYGLPYSFLTSPEAVALMAEAQSAPVEVNAALSTLEQLSQDLLQEFERLRTTYPHPTQMTSNGTTSQTQ